MRLVDASGGHGWTALLQVRLRAMTSEAIAEVPYYSVFPLPGRRWPRALHRSLPLTSSSDH